MASELSSIKDEDLLRQMWLETEDFGRKKEIRSHMYKLRETRLKDFYVHEMDSKAPITSRHGDSMADHSFESLKSNEIHGTDGPMRDIKFGPISGNTGGWNVISSTETTDDGRARTDKMLATTEGVSAVDGGKKVFSGKNEELKTERYDGDANNFTYSTGESSNMSLNENIVTGDDSNKRMESKSSSVSHTSKVVRSSTNSSDTHDIDQAMQDEHLRNSSSTTRQSDTQNFSNTTSDQKNTTNTRSDTVKLSQDAATVERAFKLAQQPGTIISRQVERANPTTNMIIEKKELADGTIVTTKRYETINSDNINGQTNITRDNRTSTTNNTSNAQQEVKKTSVNTSSANTTQKQNVETTFKTARDEEAFRLSQQPGTVISRNVEMTDPTTRMITEKKELTDGTIVTTKRYEKVTSSNDQQSSNVVRDSNTQSTKNFTNDTKSTSNTSDEVRKTATTTNEIFRTSRDEEAFRLSQQPGKIISRDVQMTNPTTRMITEKKELTDGTIVTTKRYESVDSDTQSNKSFTTEQHKINNQSKNLRNDSARDTSTNVKTTEEVRKTSTNQIFKTKRDEEAFRLAQQPGVVLERNVEMTNPTTKLVTEKKRLNDGTVVTTRVYETIGDETQNIKTTINNNNSETRRTAQDNNSDIRRTTQDTSNTDARRSVHDDVNIEVRRTVQDNNNEVRRSTYDTDNRNDQREIVEETVTKKNYDTSCHCPESMHDHKTHARDFINRERNDEAYDITKEIIVNVKQVPSKKPDFTQNERNREEVIRREEIRRLEQKRVEDQVNRRRVDETTTKITRELEVDSAHKAFASSLRCVTPPNERVSTPNVPRNDSRANRSPSRETTTSKISSSTVTVKKSSTNDVRRTDDRRTVSKSPEKTPKKVTPDSRKSTSEFTETEINNVTKNRTVNPQRITQNVPRTSSPTKVDSPRKPSVDKSAPKKSSPDSRDVSPQKPQQNAPKEVTPSKSRPTSIVRDSSPQKPDSRDSSPSKLHPRDSNSTPRATSPQKYAPTSGSSTPRDASPHKQPHSKSPSRDNSPNKPATKTTRRDENEIFSSTVVVDNRDKTFKDDLKIVQTIDTKNLSATTSVSDIEYIIPDRRRLITDLDSNDIEIKINVENFKNADDLEIKTTIHEIDDQKRPSSKKPEGRVPYNRSETFEERARKLIGVSPSETNDDELPHYAKPTYASFPSNSTSRVSEIRERKAKIEQETQEIEQVTKKTVKNTSEDFITREKNESRRSTHHFSSPDQSPTRANTKPINKKPSEYTKPHDNGEVIKTNVTKTVKTTETRHHSPEKKKPTNVETNKKVTSEHVTTKKTTCECPIRHTSPETHITLAKIHISPPRGVTTTKTTKTTETSKLKVAPSIRLVKKPLTDVSSTEPDSDVETDQELIKNIDKATSKTTRKKLMQSRKEIAPVTKTTTTVEKEKYSRSVTDSVVRSDAKKKTPAKDVAQPRDQSPKKDSKRPTKCVTTKTINLTNVTAINSNTLDDVVIDVQQAKSSREPSPNKIIPTPVRADEVINGQVIYPDKVTEPEDGKKQKPKVKNIPIFEEHTKQFVGLEITEVGTDKSHVILEEEEHEDSIINSDTLERCDRKRNSIQIDPLDDDDEDNHAHLLSVSQKVNKFISTAEELKKPKVSAPFKSDDVRLEDVSEPEDDSMLSVNRKVTKFSTTNDDTSVYEKRTREKDSMTRSVEEVDESLVDDECLLSVSDKVNKFISTAEKLTSSTPQKSPELVKNAMKGTSKSIRVDGKIEDVNESFLTKEKVSTLTREDRSDSKSTLKSVGSDITLKSTEAIKRARAVFENNTATRDIKRHDDILSRPSVWEGKRTPTAERKVYKENVTTKTSTSYDRASPVKDYSSKSPSYERSSPVKDYSSKSPSRERQSPVKEFLAKSPSPSSPRRGSSDRTPVYLRDQVSTKKDLFEKRISSSRLETEMSNRKSLSPQTSVDDRYRLENEEVHNVTRKVSSDKHYMSHTVASLEHVNNERRDAEVTRTSRRESRNNSRRESDSKSPTKFHRNISESTTDSAAFEAPRTPTKFGVELKRTDSGKQAPTRRVSVGAESIDIEEIFDLVELEKLLEIVVGYEQRRRIRAQIRVVRKEISDKKESKTTRTERVTSYSSPSRKSRDEGMTTTKVTQRTVTEKPEARAQKVVTTTTTTTTRSSSDRPKEVTQTKTTRVTNGAVASSPRNIIENLNKNSKSSAKTESVVKIAKKTSATSNTKNLNSTRVSTDTTDCVTSSYGVGPTDSNGLPLFGLKALKKKSPAVTTSTTSKTTGTVVSEVSYSENGGPAVVERKTMKYSSDPSDFTTENDSDYKTSTSERKSSRGGVYSVTKIEKFQDDGKSSVKTATVPSAKVIRRGSVKELKEKFVRKDSSSKVIESSSRSSTKRTSVDHHGSENDSDSHRVSKTYKSSGRDSKSFLNSEKKASNVQEVLTYMRNADEVHEDGDSTEDAEARALLNKFLGATALMTGIEKNSGLSKEFLSSGTASSKNPRASSASKTTKTVTSYSTSKAYDLNDIWDVDLLKKLLDSTTDYEDRRKIRARIREVMADKEACAEIVAQLTADLDAAESESVAVSEKKEEETMTKTSSEVQQKGDRIIKTTTTEVITKSTMQPQPKLSPFAKFRQLDRQNSLPNSPSPRTPTTPTTPGGSKIFTFTDPALQKKAASVKDTLLMWCQIKTKEYENVNIENFSSSWSDGLAFAALIHHFLPDAFDYSKLTPKERRHNFTLAFQIADDKAGIAPLLDVDDMVMYKKPDWKCVFCYVQSIYRRFKNED